MATVGATLNLSYGSVSARGRRAGWEGHGRGGGPYLVGGLYFFSGSTESQIVLMPWAGRESPRRVA
jgi:hypothetical protein